MCYHNSSLEPRWLQPRWLHLAWWFCGTNASSGRPALHFLINKSPQKNEKIVRMWRQINTSIFIYSRVSSIANKSIPVLDYRACYDEFVLVMGTLVPADSTSWPPHHGDHHRHRAQQVRLSSPRGSLASCCRLRAHKPITLSPPPLCGAGDSLRHWVKDDMQELCRPLRSRLFHPDHNVIATPSRGPCLVILAS